VYAERRADIEIKQTLAKESPLKYSFQTVRGLMTCSGCGPFWIEDVNELVFAFGMSHAIAAATQDRPRPLAICRHKKTDCKKVMPFLAIMRSSQRML
jgi:hypothetical protein